MEEDNQDKFSAEKKQIKTLLEEKQINIKDLRLINLFYPSLETQHSIVAHLDSLSSHVRALEEKLKKMKDECDALKQAMLREVFE